MRNLSRIPDRAAPTCGAPLSPSPSIDRGARRAGLLSTSALAVMLSALVPATAFAQAEPPKPPVAAPPAKPAKPAKPPAHKPPQPTAAAQPTPAPAAPTAPPAPSAAPAAPSASPPVAPPAAPGAGTEAPAAPAPAPEGEAPPTGVEAPAAPPPAAAEPLMPPAPPPEAAPAAPPDVDKDVHALAAQGEARRPPNGEIAAAASDVFAEDWWTRARPTLELHGYYRLRAELMYKFALGRDDPGTTTLWPQPPDNDRSDSVLTGTGAPGATVKLCGADATGSKLEKCEDNTQAGANMRFRLNPELHISDNVRVMAQVDLLDNVVLGSTPEGYFNQPGASGGYSVGARGGYTPLGAFATTQWSPTFGYNSTSSSIAVKRVWGEYMSPVGLLRFGRMPSHWGLGMLANSGDGFDSDYQSTADRIMFVTGIKKWDLYFAAAWDFANEGPTTARLSEQQGQPVDAAQLDDVNQYVLVLVRKRDPQLQRLDLARGKAVINGGTYFVFRNQTLAIDNTGPAGSIGSSASNVSANYVRRGAQAYIPDFWVQLLYKKFRFEAEAAFILGSIENTGREPGQSDFLNAANPDDNGWKLRQFGVTTQTEFRAMEDKLRLQFGFGYATGDQDEASIAPPAEGLQPQLTRDRTFSTFRFHPDYRVDLILFRNILTRVEGAYYFKPEASYDFIRDKAGQRLGGGAAVIWSRASQFVQTPGHGHDLGVELDFSLYYQAKDGVLNDDPDRMGGFFTMLNYGVLFPLSGLGFLPGQIDNARANGKPDPDTSTAQILRWYMGIFF
jgi:uncharacterized protein (TIGR04551 family)